MGGRKAGKSADFSKIRDAEGRIVTSPRFLEISLCASARKFHLAGQNTKIILKNIAFSRVFNVMLGQNCNSPFALSTTSLMRSITSFATCRNIVLCPQADNDVFATLIMMLCPADTNEKI